MRRTVRLRTHLNSDDRITVDRDDGFDLYVWFGKTEPRFYGFIDRADAAAFIFGAAVEGDMDETFEDAADDLAARGEIEMEAERCATCR